MNYVGLFEGISGFGLAFKRAGATITAVCEIDKTCQSVLRRHHPEAEIISDVKTINENTFAGRAIDILAGGFPCQDLSVAGRRKGLDGERSGLWFEFIRIISDHKPRWVVIENVPGLLSSNGGRDFAVILSGLVKCGYGVCWRILDSQYDGVAQRRQRVFIVASLGSERCTEVLFERESGGWDSPPCRETGQEVANAVTTGTGKSSGPRNGNGHPLNLITGTLSARSTAGGGLGTDFECNGGLQPFGLIGNGEYAERPATLRANGGDCGGGSEHLIAGTVSSKWPKGTGGPSGDECQIVAFTERTRAEGRTLEYQEELAYALTNPGSGGRTHSRQIAGQFGVRRLTPTECERLQGFPDGHTAFGHDGKPISDSARYRMLGNAVCVPTAEWIARRIMLIENKGQR